MRSRKEEGQVTLTDDAGVEHVAQAICDPHKENRTFCCLQGPGAGGDRKGRRDPQESGALLLNFSQP